MAQEHLSVDERTVVLNALRLARGRYSAERATQLSGVPERTVYEWATRKIVVPDYASASPKQWSYRDLVFLRLMLWLRKEGMDRAAAVRRLSDVRRRVTSLTDVGGGVVRSDGRVLLWGDSTIDEVSGEQLLAGVEWLISSFDMLEPIHEVTNGPIWAPNLVRPSSETTISPWVLGGEPCVRNTRIPTSSLHALRRDRGLDVKAIAALYPGLTAASTSDALALESRLRRAA